MLAFGNIIPNTRFQDLGSVQNPWDTIHYRALNSLSDIRLKENINPLTYGLKSILELNTKQYNYKDENSSKVRFGLIAQEVSQIIPELVSEADDIDKTLSMNYVELIPILIKAIQEQQNEIEELKKKIKNK